MKLFKYALLGILSAVALATVAKEQLVTLLRNGEVVATYKSSEILTLALWYNSSIYPVDENGEIISTSYHSWNKEMNTAIFAIEPKELLDDYTPTYELSENLEPYAHNGKVMEVDKANGLVYVYFSTPRKVGKGTVTVTLGEGDEAERGVLYVSMYPEIQSVTFYGPTAGEEIASRPYLDQRPDLGLERQYWALECEKTVGSNQEDEIRVAVNVAGGEMEDILEAVKCHWWYVETGYSWEPVEDSKKLKILENSCEIVEGHGFDAILRVTSAGIGDEKLIFDPGYMETPVCLYLTYHAKDKMLAVDENGKKIEYKRSWNKTADKAIFACDPALLEKYTPTCKADGDIEMADMEVNKEEGLIYVHFSSPNKVGRGYITVSIGVGEDAEEAKLTVNVQPRIETVTFYGETAGEEIASRPYLSERPAYELDNQYWALECEKTIDIYSKDMVRVAMNIDDIVLPENFSDVVFYDWEIVSGKDIIESFTNYCEVLNSIAFDAIIEIVPNNTGDIVLRCNTWCFKDYNEEGEPVSLTLTYHVKDLKADYPVQEIKVDEDEIEIDLYRTYSTKVEVVPESNWVYQLPTVSVADSEIADAQIHYTGSYYPYGLEIEGKGVGTTTVTLSASNGDELVTKDIKVTVKDELSRVVIDITGDYCIFAGGTTTWRADAYRASGALMNDVPLTWSSSNSSVATVDNNGVITGVAAGTAAITAASGDVMSGARYVYVVNAPDAITSPYDFQGFFEDATDIWFPDQNEGILVIPDGYADGVFEGTYNLDGAYYIYSGAKAPATGTVTISKGAGEYEYIVTMDVSINLSSTKSVSFKFTNGIVEFLPE